MPKTIKSLGEFGLIERFKKYALRRSGLVKGIGDDTAVLALNAQRYLLFTTDMMAEGTHFTRRMKPYAIGWKAMGCNISDIAAMGGIPTFAVVSLGVPSDLPVGFAEELYRGLQAMASRYQVSIVGGDTILSKKIVINVALLGEQAQEHLVTRGGARPGDWIFTTGSLGNSFKSGKHLTFIPRVEQSQFLVRHFRPNAMLDISDGLAADLGHILQESNVGAVLFEDEIPLAKGATLSQALGDGEDFELLFTLDASKAEELMRWQLENKRWYFYHIGTIEETKGLRLMNAGGRKNAVPVKGFVHF